MRLAFADALTAATTPDVFGLPPQMQSLLAVGMWVLIGAGVIGTLAAGVSVWSNLKRRPSIEETFATKDMLRTLEAHLATQLNSASQASAELEDRIGTQIRALFSKLDAQNTTFSKHAAEMERALGRIEGKLDRKA